MHKNAWVIGRIQVGLRKWSSNTIQSMQFWSCDIKAPALTGPTFPSRRSDGLSPLALILGLLYRRYTAGDLFLSLILPNSILIITSAFLSASWKCSILWHWSLGNCASLPLSLSVHLYVHCPFLFSWVRRANCRLVVPRFQKVSRSSYKGTRGATITTEIHIDWHPWLAVNKF